jgi:hypothetical protein
MGRLGNTALSGPFSAYVDSIVLLATDPATPTPPPRLPLTPNAPRPCPHSRKASLRSDEGSGDCVPSRFEARLWPRLDGGGIAEGVLLRLDDYTLRCAADGRGDWCVSRTA